MEATIESIKKFFKDRRSGIFYNRQTITQNEASELLTNCEEMVIDLFEKTFTKKNKKDKKASSLSELGKNLKEVHIQDHIDMLGFSFYPVKVVQIRKKYILGFEAHIHKVHKLKSFHVLIDGKMEHKTIKDLIK